MYYILHPVVLSHAEQIEVYIGLPLSTYDAGTDHVSSANYSNEVGSVETELHDVRVSFKHSISDHRCSSVHHDKQ